MDEKDIRKYANLMQELGLTGLEFSENGNTVRLEMSRPETANAYTQPQNNINYTKAEDIRPEMGVKDESNSGLVNICSPMVGVFYNAPAENASPFVQLGDSVKKGDVLCIIEAMKLMNEILADQDGVIAEVCAGNEQIVDYGHVLFRMKKEV
jgi:acetyl-CoA carboxylase biotin carboxyl carrier protein